MSIKISMPPKEQEPQNAPTVQGLSFVDQFGEDAAERKAKALREVREALIAGAVGDRVEDARKAGKKSVTLPDGTVVSLS